MTLSTVLELILGLVVFFYILSLIVESVTAKIDEWLSFEARDLEAGLRAMLTAAAGEGRGEGELAAKFEALIDNPLIQNLVPRTHSFSVREKVAKWRGYTLRMPGFIPPETFALALFNTLVPEEGDESDIAKVRAAVASLPKGETRKALLGLIDSSDQTIQDARQKVQNWFNDGMARVSALYRIHTRRVSFAVALVLVLLVDADAIAVSQRLWQEPTLRAAVSAEAQKLVDEGQSTTEIADNFATLQALDFPVFGIWQAGNWFRFEYWLEHFLGWLTTWLALSLGASFWYDMLKRIKGERAGTGSVIG